MKKATTLLLLVFCISFSCTEVKKMHTGRKLPSAIPSLKIVNDTVGAQLTIASLQIDVVVAANIATTTFDISFYNSDDRVLEGEFEFPLADGQNITRYALEVNGALREGVVVEKAKARVAFENTVRRNIDPGLVEKTKGNNFRTRIYPIPAKGYKRVLIAIEQTLGQEDKEPFYQLPLYAERPIGNFSISATVIKSTMKPIPDDSTKATLKFNKWENAYVAKHAEKNYVANQTLSFSIPAASDKAVTVLTESYEGQTYFYVYDRSESVQRSKKQPSSMCLLWDVSASGAKRDITKETALLKEYLSGFNMLNVSLIPFNVFMLPKEEFTITNGNASELLQRVSAIDYDGGTQYGAIDLSSFHFDEVLLFSDGLSTFGNKDLIIPQAPVTCISSSPVADFAKLKFIAKQSHGSFIDLGKLETSQAVNALKNEALQVVKVSFDDNAMSDINWSSNSVSTNGLSFSGKLLTNSADLTVQLGFGNEVTQTKTFTISKSSINDYDQVKRIWATMKIADLEMEFEKNKEAVMQLGKEYSIVTQNTSLLVLDRVEDYVQYEITPPIELQKEYYVLLKEKKENEKNETETAFDDALAAMEQLKDWWQKDFSSKNRKEGIASLDTTISVNVTEGLAYHVTLADGVAASADSSVRMESTQFSAPVIVQDREGTADFASPPAQELELAKISLSATAFKREDDKKESQATMQLNEWKPDEPYLKELEKTPAKERWQKYRQLKKEYANQPSFFVDVSKFFADKNDKKTAIIVLSNIVEMKLESSELLRIVANNLLELKETTLALETFKDIMKIKEEEPQSYRDLALAYNDAGKYNEAIELLYKLVLGKWDSRFGDVKGIALNEMNAIVSANKSSVNTSLIDSRFIYAMPMDVRIVVGWNSDNSDIDLWVMDPLKEKCFYENKETQIGGVISSDVTQGYGPEEFRLKKAVKGNYNVDVNLFGDSRQTLGGPITIKAEMFTDFGRPQQKRKTINLRVTTNKEVVNIGKLNFGS